jgi:hypothetical protein
MGGYAAETWRDLQTAENPEGKSSKAFSGRNKPEEAG